MAVPALTYEEKGSQMLCNQCGELIIDFSQQKSHILIRSYINLHVLEAAASKCAFCALVYSLAKRLIKPDTLSHCKARWGPAFDEALEVAPINVFHVAVNGGHNLVWNCEYEVRKCKSYSGGPKAFRVEGECGGFYVDPASPLASFLFGRDFEAHPSESYMVSLAKSWHDTCNTQHAECAPTDRQVPLPKRVIDLGCNRFNNGQPSLYVPPEGTLGAYLTLSYCWGESVALCLTQESLSSYVKDGVPLDRLPKTLRDSFTICRALGFRYLWVDCLCIIQDSEEDWKEQSSMMGIIYSQAALVIRAAAGAESDFGLFSPRFKETEVSVQLPCKVTDDMTGECSLRGWCISNVRDPLDSRGWALQESLLAGRTLTFGRVEMTWECRQGTQSESGFPTRVLVPGGRVLPRPLNEKQSFAFLSHQRRGWIAHVENPRRERWNGGELYLELWQQIVQAYSTRFLRFEKDKLSAIAGIAWRYSRRAPTQNDLYLAGLWRSHIPESLLWFHDLSADRTAIRPGRYRAPSWSWASLDCDELNWIQLSKMGATWAKVLSAQTTTAEMHPFGQVSGGSIQVQAPFKQGWILPSPYYRDSFNLWGDDWREQRGRGGLGSDESRLGRIFFDVRRVAEPEDDAMPAYCLMISEKAALLIEPCEDHINNDFWTRVGLVKFFDSREEWRSEVRERILTII